MNLIGLTGKNMPAMADAAEQLLAAVTAAKRPVAIALYIEREDQVRALRAHNLGLVEIWRIGADDTRPELDHDLDAFIDDGRGRAVLAVAIARQLDRYLDCITHGREWMAAHFPQEKALTHG